MAESFISNSPRTAVRRYLVELMRLSVDVGERVFPCRPSPVFLNECPCCLIYFETEQREKIIVGDNYNPKIYEMDLRVNIDFLAEEIIDPDTDINKNQKTEDQLDDLSWQAEQAIYSDWKLRELLPDDHAQKQEGLTFGIRALFTEPYNVNIDTQKRLVGQRNQFSVPYESKAFKDIRLSEFLQYKADIMRVGWDENTVDPELLEAEGNVRDG